MTDETPKQSDQLPEEAPAEQVPEDVPGADEGAAREAGQGDARREGGTPERAERMPGVGGS